MHSAGNNYMTTLVFLVLLSVFATLGIYMFIQTVSIITNNTNSYQREPQQVCNGNIQVVTE